MEAFLFDSVADILRLIGEALPMEGLYYNIENRNDCFSIVYDGFAPIVMVDLSKVTKLGVYIAYTSTYDENAPIIESSFYKAIDLMDDYGIAPWIEVALICEPDGRLVAHFMKSHDAELLGIKELERIEDEGTSTD